MQSFRIVETYNMKKSNDSTLLQTQCKIADDIRLLNHHNNDKSKKGKNFIPFYTILYHFMPFYAILYHFIPMQYFFIAIILILLKSNFHYFLILKKS
jgi:hypothetical protein